MRFQNGCNKVVIELRVLQFWSEIILVISNRTRAARSFNFEITRMISDQIALHSVPLPLFIISILKSLVIPAIWSGLSSVIYALLFALNHICSKIVSFVGSKSHHSCFKSHHFFSTSLHFWVVKAFSCFPFSTNWLLAWSMNRYWLNSVMSNWL